MLVLKAILTAILIATPFTAAQTVGSPGPGFTLPGNTGSVSLKDFNGKSKVVLVFYRGDW